MLATAACRLDPRGDRTVTGQLALEDVPTENCTNHILVNFCGVSNQLANQYCSQQAAGSIYQAGMLYVDRFFPIAGVKVVDQEYNHNTTAPAGYVAAEAVTLTGRNYYCMTHVEIVEPPTLGELITEGLSSLFGGDEEETEEVTEEMTQPDISGDPSYGEIVGE